jgi:hypothetical protein
MPFGELHADEQQSTQGKAAPELGARTEEILEPVAKSPPRARDHKLAGSGEGDRTPGTLGGDLSAPFRSKINFSRDLATGSLLDLDIHKTLRVGALSSAR